jgi:prefoldin alpha subunit
MTDEDQVRRLLIQIEGGKRQLEALSRQAQMVEAAVGEINGTVEALEALSEQKAGVELLVPAGSGTFIRASLKDPGSVLVGIGAEVSVEKGMRDAMKTLEDRKRQLSESYGSIQKTIGELGMKLAELNSQAEQMIGQGRLS